MKKQNLFALASTLLIAGSMQAQNPYLPLWEHLPDGEPRVFEDPDNPGKLRAYIIGSHDVKNTDYCGPDIRMWSAPVGISASGAMRVLSLLTMWMGSGTPCSLQTLWR